MSWWAVAEQESGERPASAKAAALCPEDHEPGLLEGDWEAIVSLYVALVCLRVEYGAQFGGPSRTILI